MHNSSEIETADYEFVISQSALRTDKPKPPSTYVRAEFAALSHPGMVRDRNEDHFLVFQIGRKQQVL